MPWAKIIQMLESTAPKIISAPKKYIKIILLSYFTEVVTFVKSLKKYFIPFFLFIFFIWILQYYFFHY